MGEGWVDEEGEGCRPWPRTGTPELGASPWGQVTYLTDCVALGKRREAIESVETQQQWRLNTSSCRVFTGPGKANGGRWAGSSPSFMGPNEGYLGHDSIRVGAKVHFAEQRSQKAGRFRDSGAN